MASSQNATPSSSYGREETEYPLDIKEIMHGEWKITEVQEEYLTAVMEHLYKKDSNNKNAKIISNFLWKQTEI